MATAQLSKIMGNKTNSKRKDIIPEYLNNFCYKEDSDCINYILNIYNKLVEQKYKINDIDNKNFSHKQLKEKINDKNYNDLINLNDKRLNIKLNNYKYNKESNAWIRVRPCTAVGVKFTDTELRLILKTRLNMNVTNQDQVCLKCNKYCDKKGDHAHNCGKGNGRVNRHDKIKELIHKELKKLDLDSKLEPRDILDDNSRPADVLVNDLFSNEKTWIDVGISHVKYDVNDYKKSNIKVVNYEKAKIKKYKKYIDENQEYKDSKYRPFMMQTDGIINQGTKEIINKIIDIKLQKSDEDKSILIGRFKSKLVATLMKSNAKNILQHYRII